MKRRHFHSLFTLASALAALPLRAVPAAPLKLRYLFASALYGDMKLADILPEVAKSGAVGLDLWGQKHATHREEVDAMGVEAFAELLKKHGVRLICSTRYPLGPFGLQPEMPLMKRLGGELIICSSRGPKNVRGKEAKAGIKEFLEQMKPHADAAAEHGLKIAIENHDNSLLSTPDSIRYWAEFNQHPALGMAFAPHHLHEHVAEMPQLIRELGSRNLPFVYLQEHGIGSKETVAKEVELQQLPGYGTLDYKPLLTALRDIGFTGYAEIFMHPTPRGIPMLPTPGEITQAIQKSADHMTALLKEVNA
jgi:sugar phosphate isomerase/epimerase